MKQSVTDILVIGGGIAGLSAAAELARTRRVTVLEREETTAYHSTGRSAALFSQTYGGGPVRALSRASREFLFAPPEGFAAVPLVKRRGSLYIARADQDAAVGDFIGQQDVAAAVERVTMGEALSLSPVLRPESAAGGGIYEPDSADLEVAALHEGYRRLLGHRGGLLVTSADVTGLHRRDNVWKAHTSAGTFQAPLVVNAAGAWADTVAVMAGARPLGIQPCRRTAALIELPGGINPDAWPMTITIDEDFYFKPDAGLLLISPADETPVDACDVQPEELDVAIAVDRLEQATTMLMRRVRSKWAGLRSFAPDRSPVIGYDARVTGFFWLAGQGGYGIQTAPAAAALAAALILGEPIPPRLRDFDPRCVSPARFQAVT